MSYLSRKKQYGNILTQRFVLYLLLRRQLFIREYSYRTKENLDAHMSTTK
jgi:hypothetical protein